MPKIGLMTEINSNVQVCFDLARSIDLHKISLSTTNEHTINGKTTGLIGLNEYVTFQAFHFGIKQKLTTKVITYKRPEYFIDVQVSGTFKSLRHEHKFESSLRKTKMQDIFEFQSPYGFVGKLFNALYLTKYLTKLLSERNKVIKEYAETDKWKSVLNEKEYL